MQASKWAVLRDRESNTFRTEQRSVVKEKCCLPKSVDLTGVDGSIFRSLPSWTEVAVYFIGAGFSDDGIAPQL